VPTHIDNFSHGWLIPGLAYAMSCLGALLGLLATARARSVTGPSRAGWLTLAAFAIGGTGIWVMHFIAMLGFDVPAADVRYGLGYTLVSILIAILIVSGGLFMIGFARRTPLVLLISGAVTGLGVASMHYTGMAAVHVNGHIGYNGVRVLLSILIAVGACTAALWAALYVRGWLATIGAALVMGVAVSGMHYTGMSAVTILLGPGNTEPPGLEAWSFLLPLLIGVSAVTLVILFILVLSPTERELLDEARRVQRANRVAASAEQSQPRAAERPLYTPGSFASGRSPSGQTASGHATPGRTAGPFAAGRSARGHTGYGAPGYGAPGQGAPGQPAPGRTGRSRFAPSPLQPQAPPADQPPEDGPVPPSERSLFDPS
jgi:NO-binding membrane sensor protein with MHYT domain